jgi:hypothetical protein
MNNSRCVVQQDTRRAIFDFSFLPPLRTKVDLCHTRKNVLSRRTENELCSMGTFCVEEITTHTDNSYRIDNIGSLGGLRKLFFDSSIFPKYFVTEFFDFEIDTSYDFEIKER